MPAFTFQIDKRGGSQVDVESTISLGGQEFSAPIGGWGRGGIA